MLATTSTQTLAMALTALGTHPRREFTDCRVGLPGTNSMQPLVLVRPLSYVWALHVEGRSQKLNRPAQLQLLRSPALPDPETQLHLITAGWVVIGYLRVDGTIYARIYERRLRPFVSDDPDRPSFWGA